MPDLIFSNLWAAAGVVLALWYSVWIIHLIIDDASIIDFIWGAGFGLVSVTLLILTPTKTDWCTEIKKWLDTPQPADNSAYWPRFYQTSNAFPQFGGRRAFLLATFRPTSKTKIKHEIFQNQPATSNSIA